jgi:hypothetical protein
MVSDRAREFEQKFHDSTSAFEAICSSLAHRRCDVCMIVSMQDIFKKDNLCQNCANGNAWSRSYMDMLPVWTDEHNEKQFYVPDVLSCLREGEKLLIQQISVYVPLHHLKYGQLGAKGHIVSFPQDISTVCTELPRLPTSVTMIRVIKHFKVEDGEIASKSFSVRKLVVLSALKWLKQHNIHYRDITIREENTSWISDGIEQQLPATITQNVVDENILRNSQEDRGPSQQQIADITDVDMETEPSFGTVREFNSHVPKVKDAEVVDIIHDAVARGRAAVGENTAKTHQMSFPFVSPDPVCEYRERYLFEKAFPWLFPGGTGGFGSFKEPAPSLADWLAKTMLYKDGRFGKDKMWAFCALNYFARQSNQISGGFFVDTFFKQGPQTLDALQEQVADGNFSWLGSISYFSHRVTGSSAYWRARRNEVFAWINYHLEQNHGPPSFFITLSCAEYHWKDIERLIIDRCEKADMNLPDFTKGRTAIVNEYTIVVQEYFQQRVQAWLDTVGKDLLGIKHHWLRFEFAPSRGQIHVHMLAICDNLDMQRKCHELKNDKQKLAEYLSAWIEDTIGMTARFDSRFVEEFNEASGSVHPSTVNYGDVQFDDADRDTASCQTKFQSHRCSAYCMRKRKITRSSESEDEKKRRVCRCGAGIEKTYMKSDTPGFQCINKAQIHRDLRGFDRVDLVRNTKTIIQSSKYLIRGWRGNCDIQLLIYKSAPDDVDPTDVSRVTNYIVSYACKGSESVVDEKKEMASIIKAAREEEGDKRDVKRIARKLLNVCTKSRVVSKQEAVCQLVGLPLYTCSEQLEPVSLAGSTRLGTGKQATTTFLSKYANRGAGPHVKDLSLDKYFHHLYNKQEDHKKKLKIPIYSGANCEATYPATAAYARGIMLIHSVWHGTFNLDRNNEDLLTEFEKFVQNKSVCPESVSVSYERARMAIGMIEPTTKNDNVDYNNFTVLPDQDTLDLVELANGIYNNNANESENDDAWNYEYGEDYDWTIRSVKVSIERHDELIVDIIQLQCNP